MMKKMKRVSMGSSPSAIEEAKNRFKLQNLIRDFDELQKETDDIKENLEKMKQKRLTLLAEVSFLRRRYKHLVKNPSQKTSAEHLTQSQKQNSRMVRGAARMKERKPKEKEVVKRNPHPSFDLNQISNPGDENMEFHVVWEPLRMDKELKRCSIEGGEDLSSTLNLSMCRDVGNGSNRTGKRKITWEDQVALRV